MFDKNGYTREDDREVIDGRINFSSYDTLVVV